MAGTVSLAAATVFLGAAYAEEKPAAPAEKKAEQKLGEAKPKAPEGKAKDKAGGVAKPKEEAKPAADDPKKLEAEERARRVKAADALLKNPDVGDTFRKSCPAIVQLSDEIRGMNLEMEQYTQIEDRKERRAAESKARGVQGKLKRAKGALDKELTKTYKPLKARYDGLKLKDKDLQARIDATSDDKQKQRLEGERAKSFGAMEDLERQMGIIEYFVDACQPPQDEAAPEDAKPKP
ncbi:MAG: hypothetical protein A3K19_08805 [Lentisphaerae bacterium RIFOXYB12_FULL_65_16]|nr:MAG: hypothetical protein A3K18_02730 [Lentisphaerae bacterium RIFOXYA12_64_32]OGV86031.1 MAG: hypothetical protein A3K19_08805 [Lentisphaerae bacterium RIFOXYB12_FULL_65_16]